MNSIVLDLQRDALDTKVRVSDLLRKALVVARKLGLQDFQRWIEVELNGYGDAKEVPQYRVVTGRVRAWNPYQGWIPIIFKDPKEAEIASTRPCGQSIAELENLIARSSDDGSYHMPFPPSVQHSICRAIGFATDVSLFTDQASLVRTVDGVYPILRTTKSDL
jgi:hypothetical protein